MTNQELSLKILELVGGKDLEGEFLISHCLHLL